MKQTIDASILESFAGLLEVFNKLLTNMFDRLDKRGLEISEGRTKDIPGNKNKAYLFTVTTGNNHKIHVKIIPASERTNVYDLYMMSDKGTKKKFAGLVCKKGPKDDVITDKITEFVEDEYGADSIEDEDTKNAKDFDVDDNAFEGEDNDDESSDDVSSSKKVVQFSVTCSNKGDLELGKVYCSYDAVQALDDISDVLSYPEAEEALSDGSAFELIPEETSFELNEIDDVKDEDPTSKLVYCFVSNILRLTLYKLTLDSGNFKPRPDSFYKVDDLLISMESNLTWIYRSSLCDNNAIYDAFKRIDTASFDLLQCEDDVDTCAECVACNLDLYKGCYDDAVKQLFNEWILVYRYNR
jgi:hypothetical protein